jgi:hypothetical protein
MGRPKEKERILTSRLTTSLPVSPRMGKVALFRAVPSPNVKCDVTSLGRRNELTYSKWLIYTWENHVSKMESFWLGKCAASKFFYIIVKHSKLILAEILSSSRQTSEKRSKSTTICKWQVLEKARVSGGADPPKWDRMPQQRLKVNNQVSVNDSSLARERGLPISTQPGVSSLSFFQIKGFVERFCLP